MKKMILPALCLSLCLTTVSVSAINTVSNSVIVMNDDRQAVKSEELPEGVKKTLATDAYKGWAVKEAALVKGAVAADGTATSHYEVVLTNEKETKTVKFNQDGSLLK
jgi:DNA-directed RNA polymerase beta subunit